MTYKEFDFPHNNEFFLQILAFVTSRHTHQGNDMYDRWKDYHERMLRPKYGEDIETHLQAITADLYYALYEQVKAKVLAYIPELADHQDKPVAMLLIKAGMFKEIGKRAKGNEHGILADHSDLVSIKSSLFNKGQ